MSQDTKENFTDIKKKMSNNIWVTADLHIDHKNIVRGETEWKEKLNACRNFETLKQHNETIINGINKYVAKKDILYVVGDFSLGGREKVKTTREKINCYNIHIIFGNHDQHIIKNAQLTDGTRTHDLFKSVNYRLYKKIHGVHFDMCHWAGRAWQNGANGSINLHGDAHGSLTKYEKLLQIADDPYLFKTGDFYKQQDVGIDVAYSLFKEYRPFNIDEIINMMKSRVNLNVDHH
jgi:calcineurin-like phosphoesterase family protein